MSVILLQRAMRQSDGDQVVLPFEVAENILLSLRRMDELLSKCIDNLSAEDVNKIFG